MKKLLMLTAAMAAMLLTLTFAGCNNGSSNDDNDDADNVFKGKTFVSDDGSTIDLPAYEDDDDVDGSLKFVFTTNKTGIGYTTETDDDDNLIWEKSYKLSYSCTDKTVKMKGVAVYFNDEEYTSFDKLWSAMKADPEFQMKLAIAELFGITEDFLKTETKDSFDFFMNVEINGTYKTAGDGKLIITLEQDEEIKTLIEAK